MANEYTSLAALKLALGTTDATRDDLLTAAMAAASRSIDRNCGRRFFLDAAVSTRTYNPEFRTAAQGAGELLIVDDIGSATGLTVAIGSAGGPYEPVTDYETLPENAAAQGLPITGLLRHSGTWGLSGSTRVQVTAQWGWPAVPDEITQATMIQALRLYKRKDSPEGILGSADWGVVRMGRIDPDVAELCKHYVLPGF